jgi:hypothetical protein
VLTRRTTIFKTNPISFAVIGSPFPERMGLELRLLEVERELADFKREGMMRTILNKYCGGMKRGLGDARETCPGRGESRGRAGDAASWLVGSCRSK